MADFDEQQGAGPWGIPLDLLDTLHASGVMAGGALAALDAAGRTSILVGTEALHDGAAVLHAFMDGFMSGFQECTDESPQTDWHPVAQIVQAWIQLHEAVSKAEKMMGQADADAREQGIEDVSRAILSRDMEVGEIRAKVTGTEVMDATLLEVAKRGGSVRFVDIGGFEQAKVAEDAHEEECPHCKAFAALEDVERAQIGAELRETELGAMEDGSVDDAGVPEEIVFTDDEGNQVRAFELSRFTLSEEQAREVSADPAKALGLILGRFLSGADPRDGKE